MSYDKKSRHPVRSEPDFSSEEELAMKIINAKQDEDYLDDLDDLVSMINPLKQLSSSNKPGLFRNQGTRIVSQQNW